LVTPHSFQILLYGVPIVLIWFKVSFFDGTMQRVVLLRTNAVVLCEVGFVKTDENVPQAFPREDIETVIAIVVNLDEGHDKTSDRAWLPLSHNLLFAIKRDVTEQRDVAKLPSCATTSLHLDGDMSPSLVGRDDVVMWNVAGEGGRDESTAREFGCN